MFCTSHADEIRTWRQIWGRVFSLNCQILGMRHVRTFSPAWRKTKRYEKLNETETGGPAAMCFLCYYARLLKVEHGTEALAVRSAARLCIGGSKEHTRWGGTPVTFHFPPWRKIAWGTVRRKQRIEGAVKKKGLQGNKMSRFWTIWSGEVNQIRARRNVPLSCHWNLYLSSLPALACMGALMIQRGAHSWLSAPHPSVAFSISVKA